MAATKTPELTTTDVIEIVDPDSAKRHAARFYTTSIVTARVLVPVLLLALWELASRMEWISLLLFSRPSDVWANLVEYASSGALLTQTTATMTAVVISLVIGVPSGIFAGFLLAGIPWLDRVFGPYLVPVNTMPRIAMVPVFIIWFGLTTTTKVAVAVSIIFFMVLFNARSGVKSIEPDLLVMGRSLGLSRQEIFRKIVLPGSVPTIFAGVRLAVTYSILGVIAAEMIAARAGLGLDIVRFGNTLRLGGVFAILLVILLIASVVAWLLERLERRLLRWQ